MTGRILGPLALSVLTRLFLESLGYDKNAVGLCPVALLVSTGLVLENLGNSEYMNWPLSLPVSTGLVLESLGHSEYMNWPLALVQMKYCFQM